MTYNRDTILAMMRGEEPPPESVSWDVFRAVWNDMQVAEASLAFEEGALAASMKFLQNPDLPPVLLMVRFAKDQTSFGDGVRWQCRREEAEAAREEALAR